MATTAIIEMIRRNPFTYCLTDLARHFNVTPPTISRRLRGVALRTVEDGGSRAKYLALA